MTRYLVTLTKSKVIYRKITKTNRPLAIVYDRLYRVDDALAYSDAETGDSIIMYDVDGQQPYGTGEYVDPEFTKVLIDSLKLGKGKIGKLVDWNFDMIAGIVMVCVIVWAIASQMLG